MKQFGIKIFLFFFIFLSIRLMITLNVPYHWGNPWYSSKVQFLEKNAIQPKTIFFGSSRIYRQIDPGYFDSLSNGSSTQIFDSYNLGAPATYCPQTYYLYKNFLDTKPSKECKLIFLELMPVTDIEVGLMHQERTSYWLNFPDLFFIYKSTFENSNKSLRTKIEFARKYSITFIERIFGVGHFREQLMSSAYTNNYLGKNYDGFFPLDYDPYYRTLKKRGPLNEEIISSRASKSSIYHENVGDSYDRANLEYIDNLISLSGKRGIDLIFVVTPRSATQEIINLASRIDSNHILDLSDNKIYPEFYSMENSFDNGHLNSRGSRIFTRKLFEAYLLYQGHSKLETKK